MNYCETHPEHCFQALRKLQDALDALDALRAAAHLDAWRIDAAQYNLNEAQIVVHDVLEQIR